MAQEFLFWVHASFIIFAASIGFFLPLPIVIFLVILHRIHIHVFDGCILSRFQQSIGAFTRNFNFLQVVFFRILNKSLTIKQCRFLDYSIGLVPVFVASIHYF